MSNPILKFNQSLTALMTDVRAWTDAGMTDRHTQELLLDRAFELAEQAAAIDPASQEEQAALDSAEDVLDTMIELLDRD